VDAGAGGLAEADDADAVPRSGSPEGAGGCCADGAAGLAAGVDGCGVGGLVAACRAAVRATGFGTGGASRKMRAVSPTKPTVIAAAA
jgi:hypothetical protein